MNKHIKRAVTVFILFYLSYSSIYIARLNFSVASALLQDLGILDIALIGIIGSIFFFTYAISKLINGHFGDKISPKIMIIIGLLLTGLSNIVISVFLTYPIIAVFWGVNAFGQAMIWGSMLRQLSFYYDEEKIKTKAALLISSVSVGSIAGLLVASYCASSLSVNTCFLIPGIIALFMCIAVFILLPFSNEQATKSLSGSSFTHTDTLAGKRNPRLRKAFLLMVAPALIQGLIKENITIWMALYFIDVYGVDIKNISGFIFFLPLLGLIGRFLYPPLYKIFRRNENHVSIFAFTVCVISVLPLCLGTVSLIIAVVCLGLISAMVSIINTHLLSIFPSHFAHSGNISFVASAMDVVVYAGAGIGSLLFGMIIQKHGYSSMYIIWGFASLISIALLVFSTKQNKRASIFSSAPK